MVNLDTIGRAVIEGDSSATLKLTKKALPTAIAANSILNIDIIWGQQKAGDIDFKEVNIKACPLSYARKQQRGNH